MLTTLSIILLWAPLAIAQAQQPILSPDDAQGDFPKLERRTATRDDVDYLTEIIVEAFPLDPQWDYQYRYRAQYPEDHWNCTRASFETVLGLDEDDDGNATRNDFSIQVMTSPSNEDPAVVRPVAVAIWLRLNASTEQNATAAAAVGDTPPTSFLVHSLDCANRRDVDKERQRAFHDTVANYSREHFVPVFKDRHLYLGTLATLPAYQRRGAGTALLNWGIELAKEKRLGISLFASPMGRPVYEHGGFKAVEVLRIQVEGEQEWVQEVAMQYDDAFEG